MGRLLPILAILFAFSAFSQDNIANKEYDYINYEANELKFDEQNSELMHFFHLFDSITMKKEGRINIVHIGGSHVQAGKMSNTIRRNILDQYPDFVGPRGLIFPYSAAKKSNNPADYKVEKSDYFSLVRNVYDTLEKPLGVSGIAVHTSGNHEYIKISLLDSAVDYSTNKIVLLGFSEGGNVVPKIKTSKKTYTPDEVDVNLRRYTYHIDSHIDEFTIQLPLKSKETFTLTGILLDNDKSGITFHSIGVNGADVPAYLKCDYFIEDMELICPDLVIFGIGINDASKSDFDTTIFRSNYHELIGNIKAVNPHCAFIFMTNNDSFRRIEKGKYEVNEKGVLARDVFYRLADDTNGAVWDLFEIMGGLGSMETWYKNGVARADRIHFTNEGYHVIGNLFSESFFRQLEYYRNLK